jgi:hypothetical protein
MTITRSQWCHLYGTQQQSWTVTEIPQWSPFLAPPSTFTLLFWETHFITCLNPLLRTKVDVRSEINPVTNYTLVSRQQAISFSGTSSPLTTKYHPTGIFKQDNPYNTDFLLATKFQELLDEEIFSLAIIMLNGIPLYPRHATQVTK